MSPSGLDRSHAARVARRGGASSALARLSDRRLGELVAGASPIGSGIGGAAARLEVAGTPVFVKQVPLTDLERRPEHMRSTANLFRLPTFCQYGVGSVGFGAWRELAAHELTTGWVLDRRCESFPVLYHWRVLAGLPPAGEIAAQEPADRERMVAYWAGSPAVRERLAALVGASASLVLFLEYLPQNLHEWLTAQVAAGGTDRIGPACSMVEQELRATVEFMNANGLCHFDAHFRNILTDGRRLYFADLGLATSWQFALSAEERAFLADNRTHDRCHTVTELVNWLVTALVGRDHRDRFIRSYADGADPAGLPPAAATVIRRYAPIAVVMNDFYRRLHLESRTTPYPAARLAQVCAATGLPAGSHPDSAGT